jgi:organic radical activating enzyme
MENIFDRPKTHVEWFLGNQCNYSCVYCHEIFRMGNRLFPSEEIITEVCKDIVYHFDELGRDVVFNFIGGEPTLSGDLGNVARRLSNHPVNMVLRTNGSASLDWWRSAKGYISDVVISVHREFADIEHIYKVIDLLQEDTLGHPVNVKVLIPTTHDERSWQWALKTLSRFRKRYGLGELQMLYSNFAKGSNLFYPYSGDQWKQYHESRGELPPPPSSDSPLVFREQPKFNGRKCWAGIDTLVIDHYGKVYRGWCEQGGVIGSIYELPIAWPTNPIICQKEICGNGFDQRARKEDIISSS